MGHRELYPIGSKERLAFALMLHTGQRRSDVHRMTWADLRDGAIRVTQQKTTTRLLIPVHADLAAVLAAAPREHVTILNTADGKPFTVSGFGNFMRDAIAGAGFRWNASRTGCARPLVAGSLRPGQRKRDHGDPRPQEPG